MELTESKAQIATAKDEVAGLINASSRLKTREGAWNREHPAGGDRDAKVQITFRPALKQSAPA